MPRPKSDLTGSKTYGIRLSLKQREMFQDIGGIDWLRNYLDRQIRSEEIQLGISPDPDKVPTKKLIDRF